MCRYLYLASDKELPLIEWEEARPAFNVSALVDYDLGVLKQFSKPHIVFLGAYTGCSCGFLYDSEPPENEDEPKDDRNARVSAKELVAYLREQAEDGPLEMFGCWNGDQGEAPRHTYLVSPEFFYNPSEFPVGDEPSFFTIRKD